MVKIVDLAAFAATELLEGWFAGEPAARHRGNFALAGGNGTEDSAVVYVELAPGQRLEEHTDSPEEVLLILEGEVEVTVGAERTRAQAGCLAVVPPLAPHSIRNVGAGIVRFVGFFPSPGVVATFVAPMQPVGERVLAFGQTAALASA